MITLTDEPKLYYMREPKERDRNVPKHINLDPDYTKLERIDKTKFKVID